MQSLAGTFGFEQFSYRRRNVIRRVLVAMPPAPCCIQQVCSFRFPRMESRRCLLLLNPRMRRQANHTAREGATTQNSARRSARQRHPPAMCFRHACCRARASEPAGQHTARANIRIAPARMLCALTESVPRKNRYAHCSCHTQTGGPMRRWGANLPEAAPAPLCPTADFDERVRGQRQMLALPARCCARQYQLQQGGASRGRASTASR